MPSSVPTSLGVSGRLTRSSTPSRRTTTTSSPTAYSTFSSKLPMPFPLRVWFVCVYWNDAEKLLAIHPAESAKEGAREIDPEEAFGSDDIRRWRDDDIEALLQLKAPIEDGIGYYVDGEWDSDRQCLIYDLNKSKPIKEGVTA